MKKSMAASLALCGLLWSAGTSTATPVWVPFDGTAEPTPPTVSILTADQTSVTFHITIHGMLVRDTVVEATTYHILSFPEEGTMSEVGLPQLPQVTKLIGFAPGATVTTEATHQAGMVLVDYNVFPAQHPATGPGQRSPFSLDDSTYDTDAWFPDSVPTAPIVELGIWRDLGTAVAVVRPLLFNPVQEELLVYTSITVTCDFTGGGQFPSAVLPEYRRSYADALSNFSYLGIGELNATAPDKLFLLIGESGPGPITAAIWPLRAWKAMRGFEVERVFVAGWNEHQVKNYIKSKFDASGGTYEVYFLLVGDHTRVALPQDGSDHWYACVAGGDEIADVPVGRIPVVSGTSAAVAAAKILRYERDQHPSWQVGRILLVNHWKYSVIADVYEAILDSLGLPYDRQNGRLGGVTNQTVKNLIQGPGGYGLLNYFGHGGIDPNRWLQWINQTPSQDFADSTVFTLQNADRLPLLYNVACSSAQRGAGHSGAWTLHPQGGGVAAWGFSHIGYDTAAATMNEYLFRLPYRLSETRTWLVTNRAKLKMLERHPNAHGFANNHRFHLVGDPSLHIWTADSGELLVQTVPRALYVDSVSVVAVRVTNPSATVPARNAVVGVYKEGFPEPEILASATTNAAGWAWFCVTPTSEGPISITAFKPLFRTGKDQVRAYRGNIGIDGTQSDYAASPTEFAVRVAPVVKGAPTIQVDVPGPARLRLTIHDVAGRMIAKMADVSLAPGRHWLDPMSAASGTGRLTSGAYFVRYQSDFGQGLLRFTLVR